MLDQHNVQFVYIFDSYAKGYAKEGSDIDLLISTKEKGLDYVGLYGEICDILHKEADLISIGDLKENREFLVKYYLAL